jgi:hypothetical protein
MTMIAAMPRPSGRSDVDGDMAWIVPVSLPIVNLVAPACAQPGDHRVEKRWTTTAFLGIDGNLRG